MSKNQHSSIILITRFPEVGKVKTRLIKSHGPEGACHLHETMTKFTLSQCQELNINVEVHYLGGNEQAMQHWLGKQHTNQENNHLTSENNLSFIPQAQGNLGDKMYAALEHAFISLLKISCNFSQSPCRKVLIIGSDCPDNRSDNLKYALDLLEHNTVVLGPSFDGGYYLIGFSTHSNNLEELNTFLSQKIHALFQDIDWGTELVFSQTKAKFTEQGLSYALLPPKSDVDYDYQVSRKISVIIPTLNEAENLKQLLPQLNKAFDVEVIVSDAHSTDKTTTIATKHGALVLSSEASRAKQISHGATRASGEILLFLHADSVLPQNWDIHIRKAFMDEQYSLGYFRFGLKECFWTKPIIEWGVDFRCKHFQLPFGDQGLFVRKKDFEAWNLPTVPILEDVFLVKCAQKYGQIVGLSATLLTSGRRWIKHGFIRTTIINACVMLCAKMGMDLELIKQAYIKGQNPLWQYMRFLKQKGK